MEEDQNPTLLRKSDKKLVRQALFSFLAILILGSVAGGAYLLGTTRPSPVQTQVLGTEVSPTPFPTEIPSLADTITPTLQPSITPTSTPTPTTTPIPTYKLYKPNLDIKLALPTSTPTPVPTLKILKPQLEKTIFP